MEGMRVWRAECTWGDTAYHFMYQLGRKLNSSIPLTSWQVNSVTNMQQLISTMSESAEAQTYIQKLQKTPQEDFPQGLKNDATTRCPVWNTAILGMQETRIAWRKEQIQASRRMWIKASRSSKEVRKGTVLQDTDLYLVFSVWEAYRIWRRPEHVKPFYERLHNGNASDCHEVLGLRSHR